MTLDIRNREEVKKRIGEILGEMAGAASMCWDPRPEGVFVSEEASSHVEEAEDQVMEVIDQLLEEARDVFTRR